MRIFGRRFLSGHSLNSLVNEHNKHTSINLYKENDFFYKFFTKKEMKIIKPVYMTVYENKKNQKYVLFTNYLPRPGGKYYHSMDSLIGEETGYNTKVISCEKCYIIG